MRRLIGPIGPLVIAIALILVAAFISGCGKGESTDATAPSDAMAPPGMPGMPPPPGASAPGMPPPPGMPPGAGGPPATPAATQPSSSPSPTSTSTPAVPGKGQVPFSSIKLNSPATRVSYTSGGVKCDYIRFKYTDWDGKVRQCEMPAGEAQQSRTPDEWLATFDLYRQEIAKTNGKKQKQVDNLDDFPFISPRPVEGNPETN